MSAIEISHARGIATVTLNRPEVRNAFNDEVIAQLSAAFDQLAQQDAVRCIVLAANGKAFCAGADLNWMRRMADYTPPENHADAAALARMLRTVYECPKPTIAKVQGDAYAGGMGLVAACDIAVASEQAAFCLSEVKLGLIPATISPYVLRAMGARAAHRYFLTAERFSAAEALRIGFVHEVTTPAELGERVAAIAQTLLTGGPVAMKACKVLLHEVANQDISSELIAMTVQAIADIRVSPEGREGLQSFFGKRRPAWVEQGGA